MWDRARVRDVDSAEQLPENHVRHFRAHHCYWKTATLVMSACQSAGFGTELCSSHGVCVDSTSVAFPKACLCDMGWTGASDMFDLRLGGVVVDTQGRALALDCPQPTSLALGMYGLLTAAYLVRQLLLMAALRRKLGAKFPGRDKRGWAYVRALGMNMPTRVLLLESVIANPIFLCFCGLKLASTGEAVIGTDPAVTVLYGGGILTMFVVFSDFSISQFRTIARSRSLNTETSDRITKVFMRNTLLEGILYALNSCLFPLAALAGDKSVGPIANSEYALIIARNVGVPIMFGFRAINLRSLMYEVRIIQTQMGGPPTATSDGGSSGGPGQGGPAASGSTARLGNAQMKSSREAAQGVLTLLDDASKETIKQVFVAGVIYAVFSLPWFWPFQQIAFAIVVSLASVANNEGLVFLRLARKAVQVAGGSSANLKSSSSAANVNGGAVASSRTRTLAPLSPLHGRSATELTQGSAHTMNDSEA